MKKNVRDIRKTVIRYTGTPLALLVWLAVWYAVSEKVGMELLVPSPKSVYDAFSVLCRDREFYKACFTSLYKVLVGWGAGIIAGTLLGIITTLSRLLDALFRPLLHIIKATPVASFIILALVLMTSKNVPSFTCALISVPIVWANVSQGLHSPDRDILEMAGFFGMSPIKRITKIYIPAVLPYFSAAAKTSMGLAWKAGIAAEVICVPKESIGAGIYDAKIYLDTPSLFAWTITVIIMSVILEKILELILRKHGGAR